MEVEVLDLLDLDAAVVLVLLHVHLGRVQRRRGLQHGHLKDHLNRKLLFLTIYSGVLLCILNFSGQ